MMSPSQSLQPQLNTISSGSLGFSYTSLLQTLGISSPMVGAVQLHQPLSMPSDENDIKMSIVSDVGELPATSNSETILTIVS